MDSYEWTGTDGKEWRTRLHGGAIVGPIEKPVFQAFSPALSPELLRLAEERDQLREQLAAEIQKSAWLRAALEAEVERGERLTDEVADLKAPFAEERELVYAQAEADIRGLVERLSAGARKLHRKGTLWDVLAELGRGAHHYSGTGSPAPEMMDTPDGPRAYPGDAPDPDIEALAERINDLRDFAANRMDDADRRFAALEKKVENLRAWHKDLASRVDLQGAARRKTREADISRIEALSARLDEALAALQAPAPGGPKIDPGPLRALADEARSWTTDAHENCACDTCEMAEAILQRLREAGVIEEVSRG